MYKTKLRKVKVESIKQTFKTSITFTWTQQMWQTSWGVIMVFFIGCEIEYGGGIYSRWRLKYLLVNAYLLYKTANFYICCIKQKYLISQYEFCKAIALVWIGVLKKKSKWSRIEYPKIPRSSFSAFRSNIVNSNVKKKKK